MNCLYCFDLHHSIINNHPNCVTYFTSSNNFIHLDSYLITAAAEHKFYSILEHLLQIIISNNLLTIVNEKCYSFIKSFNLLDIESYPNILKIYYT